MNLFKRKPVVSLSPDKVAWQKHQKALKYFIENQSSMGVYGDTEDLDAAKAAIRYFSRVKYPETTDETA